MEKDFNTLIRHKFEADLMALKDVEPNTDEFEYIWNCLSAYKAYEAQKKYYQGF